MRWQSKCNILRRSRHCVIFSRKAVVDVFIGVRVNFIIIVDELSIGGEVNTDLDSTIYMTYVRTSRNTTALRQDDSRITSEFEVVYNEFANRSEYTSRKTKSF